MQQFINFNNLTFTFGVLSPRGTIQQCIQSLFLHNG